jgi:hypothetical protein
MNKQPLCGPKHVVVPALCSISNYVDAIIASLGETGTDGNGRRVVDGNNYGSKVKFCRAMAVGARAEIAKIIFKENARIDAEELNPAPAGA